MSQQNSTNKLIRKYWYGNTVSQRSLKALEKAKQVFHDYVISCLFHGTPKHIFITKEILNFHLVPHARKEFEIYIESFGAKCKFRKLPRSEQESISKYKKRKSSVYFGSVTINGYVREKLFEKNNKLFYNKFDIIGEISISYTLHKLFGIPYDESIGWIYNFEYIEEQEKIFKDIYDKYLLIETYLKFKQKELNILMVKKMSEYVAQNSKVITQFYRKRKFVEMNDSNQQSESNEEERYIPKKRRIGY